MIFLVSGYSLVYGYKVRYFGESSHRNDHQRKFMCFGVVAHRNFQNVGGVKRSAPIKKLDGQLNKVARLAKKFADRFSAGDLVYLAGL